MNKNCGNQIRILIRNIQNRCPIRVKPLDVYRWRFRPTFYRECSVCSTIARRLCHLFYFCLLIQYYNIFIIFIIIYYIIIADVFCCFVFFVFWRFFVLFYFALSRHERQNRLVHFLENIRRITFRKFSSSPSSWNSYGSFGVTRAKLWNNTKRRNETSVANCRRISVLFCILLSFAVEHSFYSKWGGNWCCC